MSRGFSIFTGRPMADLEEPNILTWVPKDKAWAMEMWSANVWKDVRISKGELRLAWALTFTFHSTEKRCWETNATIAKRAGVSVEAVRNDLKALEKHGHILRRDEYVRGAMLRVIRPVFNRDVQNQAPRQRRGGRQSVAAGGTEVQCEGGLSLNCEGGLRFNPHVSSEGLSSDSSYGVEGFIEGEGTEEFHDREDWEELHP